MHGAVSKVKIDQALIRDSHFFRDGFEIGHRIAVQPHRDRLFQILDIRILASVHFCEIVVFSHKPGHSCLILNSSTYPVLGADGARLERQHRPALQRNTPHRESGEEVLA